MRSVVSFVEDHPIWLGYWLVALVIIGYWSWRMRNDPSFDMLPFAVAAVLWPAVLVLVILAWLDGLFDEGPS